MAVRPRRRGVRGARTLLVCTLAVMPPLPVLGAELAICFSRVTAGYAGAVSAPNWGESSRPRRCYACVNEVDDDLKQGVTGGSEFVGDVACWLVAVIRTL